MGSGVEKNEGVGVVFLTPAPSLRASAALGATAAAVLNALKVMAGIDHSIHVISPEAIEPLQVLKTKYMGGRNPRLHSDETLIALSLSAATDPNAQLALEQVPNLRGCQAHASVMLSPVDIKTLRRLHMNITTEAVKEKKAEQEV